MKLPLAWLKTFVPKLPPPQKLADMLAMHGLEVEEIIDYRGQFDRVVVGYVAGVRPHPNADKLRLADVVISPNGPTQEIVCGAPNLAVGQKVPVALLGARLPGGMTIESRPIRGVVSNGMLCAEDELGLGQSHAGIMVLDSALQPGTPFATAMGFTDVVLDISVPANRADLMSVRGLAREIATIVGATAKFPSAKLKAGPKKHTVQVRVAAPQLCRVYSARNIRGITVKPSPAWLQNYLRAAGMRSVNALVDVTNYIMLEYGQPMHAFDASKVQGRLTVRPAAAGERLITLDGIARSLDASMLVIADTTGPIALAGVMGGQYTEVTDQTTDIILEAAIFHPVSVRRTSRKLGLVSEASKRFEKGLWTSLPEEASLAAAAMIVELCGGVAEGAAVVGKTVSKPTVITMSPKYISDRLGMTVTPATAKKILTHLGFRVVGAASWNITVPNWRLDVVGPDDIVDEVGKMVGYEELPMSIPLIATLPHPVPSMIQLKDEIRDVLVELGYTEIISHSYYGQKWANDARLGGSKKHFEIANPLDETQHFLRRSVTPQVHEVLESVADSGKDAKIFELGRTFLPDNNGTVVDKQPWMLVIAECYKPRKGEVAALRVRGALEEVYKKMHLPIPNELRLNEIHTDPNFRGRSIDWVVIPDIRYAFKNSESKKRTIELPPKYQPVNRDVSFFLKGKVYSDIDAAISKCRTNVGIHIKLSDVYDAQEGRSYTLGIQFAAPDRTLTKDEVDAAMKTVTEALVKLGATIR